MHAQGDVLNVSLDLSEDHTPALNRSFEIFGAFNLTFDN